MRFYSERGIYAASLQKARLRSRPFTYNPPRTFFRNSPVTHNCDCCIRTTCVSLQQLVTSTSPCIVSLDPRSTTRWGLYYRYHDISTMAPIEFHRYTDARGDTIIYKFDPDIARNSDPAWPNDSAISVYHHYILQKRCTTHYHSDLLPLDLAIERWRSDKQSLQPIVGMVMYKENASMEDGLSAHLKTQYMWKGWGHGEGYRRGWAKLCVSGPLVNDFSVKPLLMWKS